ncbi:MAG: SusC/RagA family TonB-linked outer membrane protein, partial [Bacteroidales bacterium]|nr:SusC/RagA family TonB-linked outer membrane protein [Bacteroidales bacterium]
MKKRFLYFLFLFTGILSISTAQGQILKGVIKDHLSGETLPGANIKIKGTTTGTVTDLNGYYQVSLNPGKFIVEYSFVGYTTEEVEITIAQGETVTKNIDLYYDITTFDEFVVIGYGSQKKKVVTGAIASVKSEEIKSIPILRAEQALQGRAAGVQVTNRSGQPGEAPTIIVRGTGTTGDSRPLYVVDGFVVGSIEFLNSSDIESIDVLKDAASCAIYGARGANGVVLITTNPGSKGKMRVTYSGYQGIQNVAKTIKLLNADEYVMMMNEGARNAGQTEPFDANEIQKYNTDWQSLLFQKNAPILSHDIAFEGGDEKTTFNSSVNYFSQQGIIGGEKSMFDRITARLNTRHKMNNALNVGANINYSQINSRGIESNQSFNGAYSSALNLDPLTPVYMEDQAILNTYPYSTEPVVTTADGQVYGISENIGAEIINPLALLELQNGKSKTDWLLGNFFADLEIIKGLKLNTNAGIEFSYLT